MADGSVISVQGGYRMMFREVKTTGKVRARTLASQTLRPWMGRRGGLGFVGDGTEDRLVRYDENGAPIALVSGTVLTAWGDRWRRMAEESR